MPELPEVETIVRELAPRLIGRTIVAAEFPSAVVTRRDADTTPERVAGQRIQAVERLGKNILVRLDAGVLVLHLGMTGKLLIDGARTPYTRAVFHLNDGELLYDDVRQFGRLQWSAAVPARIAALGPEPVTISFADFWARLKERRTTVKALLLNQQFVRGMGNIYTDEALWRAGIRPRTATARLSQPRAARLHEAMVEVLQLAIAHRGSSVSDYVDASGERGSFQLLHQVYGRAGKPCARCGGPIKRVVVAQRGTHYCPRCQR